MEDHGRNNDLISPPKLSAEGRPSFSISIPNMADYTKTTSFRERVRLFRVIDGSFVIAEIVKLDTDSFTIKNPLQIMLVPHPDGQQQQGVTFMPFMMFSNAKSEVTLWRNTIVAESTPDDQFMQTYDQHFGSGIVVTGQMPRSTQPPTLITG